MDTVKLDQVGENFGFTVNKRLLGFIGVLELMISTAFTFLWIGYPLAAFNNLSVVQLVWFIIFVPSVVINGTSLVANQGEEKRELYQIYLKLGLIRLPLEIYALAKSYSPHSPYSYNFRIFEKLNLYGLSEQVILWAIIIESLLGLVLVYFRLRSVKSGDTEGPEVKPRDTKGLHGVCTLGVVVVGLLEILGSIVTAVLAITGIGRMIPINSLVCAPLWMGTAVFGALLIFNSMINSTKILSSIENSYSKKEIMMKKARTLTEISTFIEAKRRWIYALMS
uniref:Uncharacterized protein n=1 Tax=Acrobeloides nanus TaxID=290746 RepID=A0A914EB16_9BILA